LRSASPSQPAKGTPFLRSAEPNSLAEGWGMFDAVVSKEQHQLYAPNDHTCHFRVCGRGIVSQAQPTSLAVFGPLLRACFATSKMDLILRMAPSASDNGRSLPLSDIGSSCPFAINGMDRSAAYTAWREGLTICRPQITTRLLSSTLTLHAEIMETRLSIRR
jgi:hypothetical protein